jgi:hypothetical protein
MAMDMAMDMVEAPGASLVRESSKATGLGRETYATFLLIAIAGFIIAGYLGLALFFVGAVR